MHVFVCMYFGFGGNWSNLPATKMSIEFTSAKSVCLGIAMLSFISQLKLLILGLFSYLNDD